MGAIREVDRGWKELKQELRSMEQCVVDVGVQAGEQSDNGQDLASIAAYNEFGTDRIPERPFMRSSFDENVGTIEKFAQDVMNGVEDKRLSVNQALDIVGQKMTGIIQKKIVDGPWTPNDPATIAQKGSDRPLIDTGRLRQSIRHVVKKK